MIAAAVNFMPEVPTPEVADLAHLAETLGYRRCWVYDEGLTARDVYVTLTAVALATSKVSMGPGITNPFTRHPGSTAAAIATLDELSGGRAFLGLGAGGSLTLDPLGIDRRKSMTAVRETVAACRALFSGALTDYQGTSFALRRASLAYARPDLEIWVAGRGPKMLALGGEVGDGVLLEFIHRDLLVEHFELVRAAGAPVGNSPRLCYSTFVITDAAAMQRAKRHFSYRFLDSPPRVRELIGMTDADVEVVRAALPNGLDAAAAHIKEEWVEPFVFAGTVGECGSRIAALSDLGVEEFLLPVVEVEGARHLMEIVAEVFDRP